MATFDEATTYDSNSSEQTRFGLDLIEKISVPKGGKLLDLGCGTGKLAQVLANLVGPEGQVVAIDPDASRLKIAQEKRSSPNIVYFEAGVENLPGDRFDLIYSNFVLHLIKNHEMVFQQAQNVLKQNGLLAFSGPIELDKYFPQEDNIISEEFKENTVKTWTAINMDNISIYASKYGFECDYIKTDIAHFDCKSLNGLIQCYWTHCPSKLRDLSHFNLDKLIEYFGNKFVLSPRIVLVVYRKL